MADVRRIIAATDFSPAADRATRRAACVASAMGAALELIHVLPPQAMLEDLFRSRESELNALRMHAESALKERGQRIATQFAITPGCRTVYGRAHEAVLTSIESLRAHLVVIGAQGEGEGVPPSNRVGDTALKILELAQVPALLVRRETQQPYAAVVGCVKGDRADPLVIQWTNRMAPADLIHIVSAHSVPYERRLLEWGASQATLDVYSRRELEERTTRLSRLLQEVGLPAARARLHVERGEPLPTILRTAERWQADLIIVGRRTGPDPLVAGGPIGSVARAVAFQAPVDVMIVPPTHPPQGP